MTKHNSTHGVDASRPARCPQCKREGFLHSTWCPVGMGARGVKVPQVRLIGTACSSDPCEREQQCRSAGTCDPWRGRFPKDGDWPCEECGKPEKEHVGAGQQCPGGAKRFFPGDPDGVMGKDREAQQR